MTKFQYINKNIERFRREMKMGIIPCTAMNYYTIYSRYNYYRKIGYYVGLAVLYTSDSCKVTERCVYRAIKDMEKEV